MLKDFFTLDGEFIVFKTLNDLEDHFKTSSSLENVLFEPDSIVAVSNNLFKRRTFKNVSFAKTMFKSLTMTDCHFVDCLFIGTRFINCHFHGCTFTDCNPHRVGFEKCHIDPNSFLLDKGYKTTHSNIGTWLFHELFMNSKNMHQSRFSGDAEIQFNRWKRAQLNYEFNESKKARQQSIKQCIKGWFLFAITLLLDVAYDWLNGYGNRPVRFFVISIVMLLFVSMIIHIFWPVWGLAKGPELLNQGSYLTSIYYTTVVTTTLGFGDITPTTDSGRTLAIILSISGVIWLALLAATIIKRLIR